MIRISIDGSRGRESATRVVVVAIAVWSCSIVHVATAGTDCHCATPDCTNRDDCNDNGIPDECDVLFINRAVKKTSGTTVQVSRPVGTRTGMLLIGIVAQNDGAAIEPPVGWSVVDERNTGRVWLGIYSKIADASAHADGELTATGLVGQTVAAILAYAGVDGAVPVWPNSPALMPWATGTGGTPTAPSIETEFDAARVLRAYAIGRGCAVSADPVLRLAESHGPFALGVATAIKDTQQIRQGETGASPLSVSGCGSNVSWIAASFALRPAGGSPVDCDGNTILDECDITEKDCNGNEIPDICDAVGNDCDANGIPDECDISAGALDCNGNGRPDECDLTDNDCNGNGMPDECDLGGVMYYETFERRIGPEWSSTRCEFCDEVPDRFTRFSGRFGNERQELTLDLYPNTQYTLEVDLAIIDSWDGCEISEVPDLLKVYMNEASIFSESFHRTPSYPPDPCGDFSGCQSFAGCSSLTYADWGWNETWYDSLYRNVLIPFSTTGAEVTIAFEGENLQSRDDESWGIDNVRILAGSGIGPATSTDCNNNAIPDECEMQQSRLYVNVNAEGGDTGFSWDDAFTDLQDALKFAECAKDGAEPITEIWVADGVYVPGDNESASFALVDNVGLYGGFAGGETELEQRDPQANVAVLSGDILGDDDGSDSAKSDNSTHVVTADRVSGAGFDGFTVTGGTANGHGGSQSRTGGGLWINGTAGGEGPTVVNSRFVDNHAADGGGAVYSTADGAIFIRCEFVGNEAVSGNGGAVAVAGGGTGNEEPNFVSCLFRDNQCGASDQGGGLFITSTGGGVVVRNCVFAHNVAGSGGGLALGGSVLSSPKQILNSTFAYNTVRREGGGINSTVDVTATNCVFWNNSRGDIVDADAQVSFDTLRSQLRFSLVHGGIWGPDEDGNISDQGAQVLDADSRLGADSPAIDAGDNQAVEEIPYDKDGHPRVLVGRPDPLDPPTPTVDMGAYEFADCDGNGTHDVEQIEADPTKDCDEDLVLDDCVLSAPFEAHSGDLGPIGVGQPRSFFAGTINPARGDVVVTVTARADLEADDTEYLDVIIISRTGESDEHRPVFKLAGADDCTEVTSSVRFEESTFNRLFPTAGQGGDRGLVIKIDASDTVAPDACGDDGSVSVSVSFDERINDCQLNNRLDACDIADPNGSNDLDGDGVPDECRNDCNANGVTDECDLDCLAEGCDVSTCGTKSDCNRNGRPDECEVACIDGQACHCFSGCDPDCNMNGLPDECDVGDPDEPSRWVGGHSCVDNNGEPISGFECWDIAANWCPDTVPDNLSGTKFTVEVAGQENAPTVVTMDISPTITRLDLGPYASVGVDQASGALVRTLAAEAERPVDEGPDPIENAGTLFARDGRRLVLDAEAINQSVGEGALEATGVHPVNESPSIVEVNGATVIGGRATTTDGGEIHLIGGAELQDVEVDGVLVPNGQTGAFSGSVFNKGLLEVGRGGPEGALFRPDGQENNLAPGGGDCSSPDNCVVRLGGQTTAMLGNFKLPFVNETDHKIEGAGVIFGEMTNNGKIHANRAGEQLILFPTGPKSNNGDLMATADATLRIADAVYQSGTGRIRSHTVCGSVLIEAPVTGEGSFLASGSTAKRGGCVPPPAQMSISTGLSTEGSTLRVTDGALVEFEASSTMALAQTMEIDSGGRVRGSGELAEPPTALSAGRLHISNSGALELSKNMHFGLYCRGTYRGVAAARGGCVPPPAIVELGGALVAKDASSVDIDGTIRLQTGGQIEVGCRAAFSVGENLDNLLIDPTTFDWARGSLLMDGDQILLEGQQQRLEAAGKDRGPVASGFVNNFAFGTLELAPGAVVEVADAFDNPQDGLEVCDAVYVRRLVVGPGATVDAPGCKIYYTALENLGTIFTLGESVIEVVVDGDWDTNGIVDLADYAGFFSCMAGPWCQDGPARPSELCLNTFDFDVDGDIDLLDAMELMTVRSSGSLSPGSDHP